MRYFAGLLAIAGLLWCTQPEQAPFTSVPPKARLKVNPLAHDANAVAAGRKLFGQHCAECHGRNAQGSRRAPCLYNPDMQRATPGEIFWIVTNGVIRHGMPSWSRLPEPERWQIAAFLESLKSQ